MLQAVHHRQSSSLEYSSTVQDNGQNAGSLCQLERGARNDNIRLQRNDVVGELAFLLSDAFRQSRFEVKVSFSHIPYIAQSCQEPVEHDAIPDKDSHDGQLFLNS